MKALLFLALALLALPAAAYDDGDDGDEYGGSAYAQPQAPLILQGAAGGAFDQYGRYYQQGAGGVLTGNGGSVLVPSAGGYVDTGTGRFIPR